MRSAERLAHKFAVINVLHCFACTESHCQQTIDVSYNHSAPCNRIQQLLSSCCFFFTGHSLYARMQLKFFQSEKKQESSARREARRTIGSMDKLRKTKKKQEEAENLCECCQAVVITPPSTMFYCKKGSSEVSTGFCALCFENVRIADDALNLIACRIDEHCDMYSSWQLSEVGKQCVALSGSLSKLQETMHQLLEIDSEGEPGMSGTDNEGGGKEAGGDGGTHVLSHAQRMEEVHEEHLFDGSQMSIIHACIHEYCKHSKEDEIVIAHVIVCCLMCAM